MNSQTHMHTLTHTHINWFIPLNQSAVVMIKCVCVCVLHSAKDSLKPLRPVECVHNYLNSSNHRDWLSLSSHWSKSHSSAEQLWNLIRGPNVSLISQNEITLLQLQLCCFSEKQGGCCSWTWDDIRKKKAWHWSTYWFVIWSKRWVPLRWGQVSSLLLTHCDASPLLTLRVTG